MTKLLLACAFSLPLLLDAKDIRVVDAMLDGAVQFAVPDDATVRSESGAGNGAYYANQAFAFNVDAGYLITTLQLKKSNSNDSSRSVRTLVAFRPAGEYGTATVAEVVHVSHGPFRAVTQATEFKVLSGRPAVGARLFSGKSPQEGVPSFPDSRFSCKCLIALDGADFLFAVNARSAAEAERIANAVLASAKRVSAAGLSEKPQDLDFRLSVGLERGRVVLGFIGPFKVNGSTSVSERYAGNVLVNSVDGSWMVAFGESPVNAVDRGADDDMRMKLCSEMYVLSGGDIKNSEGKVTRAANEIVTCVHQVGGAGDRWVAQYVVVRGEYKVNMVLSASTRDILSKLMGAMAPAIEAR